ncbi:MAG: hypothetical protein GF388_07055 [Candidatus Aegiribacteria sp.]|nr:hypothetical protein [Candidatus Aegiribacteria sp.]MBD3294891.1 hypothetical protein [Candidatus Fermentibacteria bacterium]
MVFLRFLVFALLAESPSVLWTGLSGHSSLAVRTVGDVNGNGTEDMVALTGDVSGSDLWCLDGLTSEVLWNQTGLPSIQPAECFSSVPDANGDGILEVAAGLGGASEPTVFVVSGLDGQILWSLELGYEQPIYDLACAPGSQGEPSVIVTSRIDGYFVYFTAIEEGSIRWEYGVFTYDPDIHTLSDFSGNDRGEMGYCVDRRSITSGGCYIKDGYSGGEIFSTSACYYPQMDVCDFPEPLIAVGQDGYPPDFRLETVPGGEIIFSLSWSEAILANIQGVVGVEGGPFFPPVLIGWDENYLNFIHYLYWPYVTDSCYFPNDIVKIEPYQAGANSWKLAVLTKYCFHTMDPYYETSPGPFCDLPSLFGKDICMLQSDQYPAPLAAAVVGGDPCLCVIETSNPLSIEGESSTNQLAPSLNLISNPTPGGLSLFLEDDFCGAVVLDMSGRQRVHIDKSMEDDVFVELPPGVYLIVPEEDNPVPIQAIVI